MKPCAVFCEQRNEEKLILSYFFQLQCSVTCGVGYQTRKIVCRRSDGENIHERQCHAPSRPVDRQECKTRPCPADVHAAIDAKVDEGEAVWMTGAWTIVCPIIVSSFIKRNIKNLRFGNCSCRLCDGFLIFIRAFIGIFSCKQWYMDLHIA